MSKNKNVIEIWKENFDNFTYDAVYFALHRVYHDWFIWRRLQEYL